MAEAYTLTSTTKTIKLAMTEMEANAVLIVLGMHSSTPELNTQPVYRALLDLTRHP